jgi:hypothetical protein
MHKKAFNRPFARNSELEYKTIAYLYMRKAEKFYSWFSRDVIAAMLVPHEQKISH